MSTTDVHRMLDNKLPQGKKCEGVTMVETYTATIDGQEFTIDVPLGTRPEDVADWIVASVAPGSSENAQLEGAEITEADEAEGGPEPEYDDEDEYEREPEDHTGEKPKSKTKKKK